MSGEPAQARLDQLAKAADYYQKLLEQVQAEFDTLPAKIAAAAGAVTPEDEAAKERLHDLCYSFTDLPYRVLAAQLRKNRCNAEIIAILREADPTWEEAMETARNALNTMRERYAAVAEPTSGLIEARLNLLQGMRDDLDQWERYVGPSTEGPMGQAQKT